MLERIPQNCSYLAVHKLEAVDRRGDRGAAAARQDGLGDVILSIACGGNTGCGVRLVI